MLAALPIAALAFTSAPTLTRSGALVTRSPTPVAAIDVNSLDQQQVAIIGGAVLALGGAIAYGKQNEDGSAASAPSPPKPAKSTPPARKPVARAKPKGWGLGNYGKSKAPHPMAGPWPKAPKREEWVPPEGWAPPSMPPKVVIESWYDSGMRLRDDGVVVPSGADSSSEMTVAQACAFFAANPSIDAAEKKAFLLSKGVSDFVIAQAECTATGMEKSVAGHP